jgi:hypothetical protein
MKRSSNSAGRFEVSPLDLLPSRITFGPSIPAGEFQSVSRRTDATIECKELF